MLAGPTLRDNHTTSHYTSIIAGSTIASPITPSSCAQYQMPSVKQSTAIVEAAYATSNQLANERRCRDHIMLSTARVSSLAGPSDCTPSSLGDRPADRAGVHVAVSPSSINIVANSTNTMANGKRSPGTSAAVYRFSSRGCVQFIFALQHEQSCCIETNRVFEASQRQPVAPTSARSSMPRPHSVCLAPLSTAHAVPAWAQ